MIKLTRRHVLVLTAAASAAAVTQAARATAAKNHMVDIRSFKFVPDTLTVAPGDTITWTNRDLAPHTATGVDKSWDTGAIEKDESVTLTVTADFAGDYFCRFHPNMKADLTLTRG